MENEPGGNLNRFKINGFVASWWIEEKRWRKINIHVDFSQEKRIVNCNSEKFHKKVSMKTEWRLEDKIYEFILTFCDFSFLFHVSRGNFGFLFHFALKSRFSHEFRVQFMCLLHLLMAFYDVCNLSRRKNKIYSTKFMTSRAREHLKWQRRRKMRGKLLVIKFSFYFWIFL